MDAETSWAIVLQRQDKVSICYFYMMASHVNNECLKYLNKWLATKGDFSIFILIEINLASLPPNTWRLDSGVIMHISVTMLNY